VLAFEDMHDLADPLDAALSTGQSHFRIAPIVP
jgi:hypothetical protein